MLPTKPPIWTLCCATTSSLLSAQIPPRSREMKWFRSSNEQQFVVNKAMDTRIALFPWHNRIILLFPMKRREWTRTASGALMRPHQSLSSETCKSFFCAKPIKLFSSLSLFSFARKLFHSRHQQWVEILCVSWSGRSELGWKFVVLKFIIAHSATERNFSVVIYINDVITRVDNVVGLISTCFVGNHDGNAGN